MKLTKYIPYALLIIAVLYILHLHEMKRNQRMSLESVINQKSSEFKIRLTADSLRIASQSRAQLTNANEISKYYAKELEAVKKELGGKIDKMQSLVRATFLVTTQGKVKPAFESDTTKQSIPTGTTAVSATFKDKHFDIYTRIDADTALFKASYSATFTAVGFVKKRLLKKDQYFINAYLDDKNASITGLTNFEVKEFKDKRFGVGPFVGYDFINNRPSAGIAVYYSLFKF